MLQSVVILRRVTRRFQAVVLAVALGCGGGNGGSESGEEGSSGGEGGYARADLDAAIQASGASVRTLGQVHQPFFSVPGARLAVEGGDVAGMQELQVYEYPTESEARGESDLITSEGGSATAQITWIADPHFFRRGRLTVIYVGSDAATLALLQRELGAQFAGR
jgi:hypothetical protein